MYNGIKPTRLWHRTGRKHFWRLVNERINARPGFDVSEKKDRLQILAIVLTGLSSIMYSYGMFSPPLDTTTIIRPPGSCDGVRRRCPNMPPCGSNDSRRR
ncbi:hypothetical protein O3G_MSEX013617 [Manduca sexta]|uniref:Uncharacterized protein n=1 Tax=Manduca sexta TaxID=7130 RepID=A0A921ZRK2_MANSE|nr:hypothetical protein O3G_MSEX013617 [Manduca sexta]